MILACLLASSSEAAVVVSDGSYFNDEFNGASLDAAKWTEFGSPANGNNFVAVAGGVLTVHSGFQELERAIQSNVGQINYGGASQWATEISFRVLPLSSAAQADGQRLNTAIPEREVVLLGGGSGVRDYYVTLGEATDLNTNFTAMWGAFNGPSSAAPIAAATTGLSRNQFYKLVLHHRIDDEIDIYLDDVLVSSRSAINPPNDQAERLLLGDISGATAGIFQVDYVRVGAPISIPEPGSLALLVVAGGVAMARRPLRLRRQCIRDK